MTTPFQDAAAQASAAVDTVYGESFIVTPMTRGNDVNARPIADPDRAPASIVAAFLDVFARADSGPARTQGVTAEKHGHASSRQQASFDRTQLSYAVKRGDRLQRASDNTIFEVAEIRRAYPLRDLADLNRMS